MHRVFAAVGILLLGFIACEPSATPTPTTELLVESSVRFWAQAKPIVERQIAEVGQPLATILLQIDRDLRKENPAALSQWYETLLEVGPRLKVSYDALSSLSAPPGRATRWHQAQLRAWGMRLDSIDVLSANWSRVRTDQTLFRLDPNSLSTDELLAAIRTNAIASKGGFNGTDADFALMSQLWDQSILAGLEADRLQNEILDWLQIAQAR